MKEILGYFSERIRNYLQMEELQEVEEIRLRIKKPIILKRNTEEKILNYIVNTEDILETLQLLCDNSIYTYQNQICNGFITVKGGHRVGITGTVVMEEEKIVNINYIASLNFRIARQIVGCSDFLLPYLVKEKNDISNTLIVSPPGSGKTTILRDLVRNISNKGKTIGVVDERGEIAAMYRGVPQNDLGIRTDVIENVSKVIGMKMLIRSMAPKIIVADEIGNKGDIEIIQYAVCCGIKGIFTAHGSSIQELKMNPELRKIMEGNVIEKIVFLKNKKISEIYQFSIEKLKYEKEF